MDDTEIWKAAAATVSRVFKIPQDKISMLTKQEDLEMWDSLGHIQLFLALEQHLKISFELGEIEKAHTVGDIVALIKKRNKGEA